MSVESVETVCFTLNYSSFPFERALQGIANAGFGQVAVWLFHSGKQIFGGQSSAAEVKLLAKKINSYHLKPYLVSAGLYPPPEKDEELRSFKKEIELAGVLGARYVLTIGAGAYAYGHYADKQPLSSEEFMRIDNHFVASMRMLGDHADKHNITILIKPHTGNTATAKECLDTMKRIDHQRVKIAYDGGNVRFYEGVNPEEDVMDIARQTECLIVKDHQGSRGNDDFPTPGEGEIDYVKLYSNARRKGFHGALLIEQVKVKGDSAVDVDREINKAKLYLDKILANREKI